MEILQWPYNKHDDMHINPPLTQTHTHTHAPAHTHAQIHPPLLTYRTIYEAIAVYLSRLIKPHESPHIVGSDDDHID